MQNVTQQNITKKMDVKAKPILKSTPSLSRHLELQQKIHILNNKFSKYVVMIFVTIVLLSAVLSMN